VLTAFVLRSDADQLLFRVVTLTADSDAGPEPSLTPAKVCISRCSISSLCPCHYV
jgi:hypothetical protein